MLTEDNVSLLVKSIEALRKEKEYTVPLIHIAYEIEIDANSHEIRDFNKSILRQNTLQNKEHSEMIEEIIKSLDEICKGNKIITNINYISVAIYMDGDPHF